MKTTTKQQAKSEPELAQETEFQRRRNMVGCEVQYVGLDTIVLTCLGVEIGTKTNITRRGKLVAVLYNLPSLDRLNALLTLPVRT